MHIAYLKELECKGGCDDDIYFVFLVILLSMKL